MQTTNLALEEHQAKPICKEAKRRRLYLMYNTASSPVHTLLEAKLRAADAIEMFFRADSPQGDLSLGMLFNTATQQGIVNLLRVIKKHDEAPQQTQLPEEIDLRLYERIRGKIKRVADVSYTVTVKSDPYPFCAKETSSPEYIALAKEKVRYPAESEQEDSACVEAWNRSARHDELLGWINGEDVAAHIERCTHKDGDYCYNSLTVEIPAVLAFVDPLELAADGGGGEDMGATHDREKPAGRGRTTDGEKETAETGTTPTNGAAALAEAKDVYALLSCLRTTL